MAGRVSQIIGEIHLIGVPHSRVSQIVVEAQTIASSGHHARASQIVLEAELVPNPHGRASQIVFEVLVAQGPRASQMVFEVLILGVNRVAPPIFPALKGLSFPFIKTPVTYTGRGRSASGRSVRVGYADVNTWKWELSYPDYLPDAPMQGTTSSDYKTLLGFWLESRGGLFPFLFEDPDDNTQVEQGIATGDGATTDYLLARTIGNVSTTPFEPVGYVNLVKPFQVYLNGVLQPGANYSVNQTAPMNQRLVFVTAPAVGDLIHVTFSWYFYCCFSEDTQDFEKFMSQLWQTQKLTIESLRG